MFITKTRIILAALVAIAALSSTAVASAASRTVSVSSQKVTTTHTHVVSRIVRRGSGPVVTKVVVKGAVAMISAFPAGGKGSGTEATCNLWSGRLQEEQGAIEAAEDKNDLNAYQEAKGAQDEDVDNALDAGCAVIY